MRVITPLIANSAGNGNNGSTFHVYSPATEQPVAECHAATPEDVDRAMQSAGEAQLQWRELSANSRAALLTAIGAELERSADAVATLISEEQGKPWREARGEAEFAAQEFSFAAQHIAALEQPEQLDSPSGDVERTVVNTPRGVVAVFPSSNYPAAIVARKLAALLAAGCSAVVRAPEEAPSTTFAIAQHVANSGAPPGLVNALTGNAANVTNAMISHPACAMVSFTGSERVGKLVLEQAGRHIKPAIAELGGHCM